MSRGGNDSGGEFPRRGSPGILFARLKGSPPWLPFLEPGGDYCLASAGSAADGRVGGENDSARGRAGGCSREHARRRCFSGSRGRQLEVTRAPTRRAGWRPRAQTPG